LVLIVKARKIVGDRLLLKVKHFGAFLDLALFFRGAADRDGLIDVIIEA
jgi:hypothetical protein